MDQERIHFGSRLKHEREARHLSLGDVARVTKIPERSLERLEGGRFEELPAEVFVRGFVRSYARAVGLDADDMARRYAELMHTDSPRLEPSLSGAVRAAAARAAGVAGASGSASAPAARAGTAQGRAAPRAATQAPRAATVSDAAPPRASTASAVAPSAPKALPAGPANVALGTDDVIVVAPVKAKKDPSHTDELRTLSKAILDAGRETRRLPLTLAVIILVIVATLAMSLLLDRPSHIGDGITSPAHPAADARSRA